MSDWSPAELGANPGVREGREGAPLPGSRCRPAADTPATRPAVPGLQRGSPHVIHRPRDRARPHQHGRRPFHTGPGRPPGRTRSRAGARGRCPPALSGPRLSPAATAPELGAGASACRAGGRLRARPAGAPPHSPSAPPSAPPRARAPPPPRPPANPRRLWPVTTGCDGSGSDRLAQAHEPGHLPGRGWSALGAAPFSARAVGPSLL